MTGVVLGVDYGLSRVGLARSDESRSVVVELGTLVRTGDRRLARELARIAQEVAASEVVIGLPYRDDGASTPVLDGARRLAKTLARASGLEVAFVDESGSSLEADASASASGIGRHRARRGRDARAAATILERYLAEGASERVVP